MNPNPLFILAPPRSFTSVICGIIGSHPQMYALPEVNLFAADDYDGLTEAVYSLRPGFRHGLLRAIAELGLGDQSVENIDAAGSYLEENHALPGGEIFADLAAWAAPRALVDKSPLYVYTQESLERIDQAFPNARYLHLTRHPRGTCESVFKLREKVQKTLGRFQGFAGRRNNNDTYNKLAEIEDPESLWLEPHKRIMKFLANVPVERRLWLRGEEFMGNPDAHLPLICEWLEIDTDQDSLEAMKHPEDSPYACLGPTNARFGNDPSYLEAPELRKYTPKALSFEGPLAASDGVTLSEAVIECARGFGYA